MLPLLQVRGVHKYFGGVHALEGVDFEVGAGEVVGLVGDNAAGKSTLARIIAGVYRPDAGDVLLEGKPVQIASPKMALDLGIATVFQEFALVESLDVVSNLFLGREIVHRGLLARDEMERLTRSYLRQLNSRIPDVHVQLQTLSAGQRQCVSIARALVTDPRIIVLDEPTASLSVAQTAEVLQHIERLRDMGLGVVFIGHNLSDIRAVADRIEVLRHGHNNGSFPAGSAKQEDLLAAITGAARYPSRAPA